MRRLSLGLALVILVLSLAGWLGDRFWVGELSSSIRPQLLIAAILVGVVALVLRAGVGAVLIAIAIAANVFVLASLYGGTDTRPVGLDRLVIAHVNMQHRGLDQAELAQVLNERKPDLLFLLDPPREWVRKHRAFSGYGVFGDGSPKVAAVVLAVQRPSLVGRPFVEGLPGSALVVETTIENQPLWILGLHTQSPMTPHKLWKRNRTLRIAGLLAAQPAGARIVLGDLNATPWSDALKQLERVAGLKNSMEGRGVQSSWPALLGPFGVAIDQFLASDEIVVLKRQTGPTFGSTHRSVWVTVALAQSQ